MPTFDVDPEEIVVFHLDNSYWFTHYFERDDLFDRLEAYYDPETYRFELPEDEFENVRDRLAEEYIELVVADDLERYCVLKDEHPDHAELLRNSVANWERHHEHVFLLQDELAVREAIERGASRVDAIDEFDR